MSPILLGVGPGDAQIPYPHTWCGLCARGGCVSLERKDPLPTVAPALLGQRHCGLPQGDELTPKQAALVSSKIVCLFSVAAAMGHKRLVLGAWGCGAFGNSATVVAQAFYNELFVSGWSGCFSSVVFAVPGKASGGGNFEQFQAVFKDKLA